MDATDSKSDANLKIWRLCEHIKETVFYNNIHLKFEHSPNDHNGYGLIEDSKFISELKKYQDVLKLSDADIQDVTNYFRIRDGRIAYNQFMGVLCKDTNTEGVELQGSDANKVNTLTDLEKRQLCILLMRIAKLIILPLLPYFQDYEMITNNGGSVTVAHFSRVLHFMKLDITEKDFMLLLKRYMLNSYTVNYLAFLKHIDALKVYLKNQGSKVLLPNDKDISIPGNLIDLEIPELPIPKAKQAASTKIDYNADLVNDIIQRIQRYVYENRVRITEFMAPFDLLNVGRITKPQFVRALDCVGISESKRLKLCTPEIDSVAKKYTDVNGNIKWKEFTDEVDRVFTEKNLEKHPQLEVESPLKCVKFLPKPGQESWHRQHTSVRELCEETIQKIQNKINTRGIYLYPFFKNYDKLNKGYCRPNQALQVLISNAILLSDEEFQALKTRYCNEMGFNYIRFLEEVDPLEYAVPKATFSSKEKIKTEKKKEEHCSAKRTQEDMIQVLSKIRKQIGVSNAKVIDFLIDYDHHRQNQIPEADFRRGLDNANIKLTVPEADIICNIFRSRNRGCHVRYRDFCKALDEIFIQRPFGEENMLPTPLKHFPCVDCVECFLNFEERTIASKALQKLANKPDQISNLQSIFKDFDKENCGTVSQNRFLRALTVRDMHNMISSREFEVVCKCFGYERGLTIEFNYRDFLNILDILHQNGQVKRHF